MKKVLSLFLLIVLLTGGRTLKSYNEDAKLIAVEVERHVSAQNRPTLPASDPTPSPTVIIELPAPMPKSAESVTEIELPFITAPTEPDLPLIVTPAEPPTINDKSTPDLPFITAPAEPELPYITAPTEPELPFITAPAEPQITVPTSEPAPIPLQTPEPTPQPIEPLVIPSTEPAQDGYAECSCGSILGPDELVSHMKAHALNGESHSYRAY